MRFRLSGLLLSRFASCLPFLANNIYVADIRAYAIYIVYYIRTYVHISLSLFLLCVVCLPAISQNYATDQMMIIETIACRRRRRPTPKTTTTTSTGVYFISSGAPALHSFCSSVHATIALLRCVVRCPRFWCLRFSFVSCFFFFKSRFTLPCTVVCALFVTGLVRRS